MQAVLILAHKDVNQVVMLAQKLRKKFEVYIHFDEKTVITETQTAKLEKLGVKIFSKINVMWGGWSIGEAAYLLMKEALKNPKIKTMHVISGQDWPAQKVEDIYNFFNLNPTKIYMTYRKAKDVVKSGEPTILWQKYYFNYDKVNRRTIFGKFYHRGLLLLQFLLKIDKFEKLGIDMEIYTGANWMSLPRDAVQYSVNFLDTNLNFLEMLKTGCFSDEFWVQTILCNSSVFSKRIVNQNYRFVKWEKKNGSYPAILDKDDYDDILHSGAFFMRKISLEISGELLNKMGA